MQATLEWNFDLLAPDEQRDLARLSVFAGGCTLEAAEAVCETTRGLAAGGQLALEDAAT